MENVLLESLKAAVIGMGIVMLSLYFLSLILDVMRYVFYKPENTQKKTIDEPSLKSPLVLHEEEINPASQENLEEIAAITAAIAAYLGKPLESVKIGAIRRIYEKTPVWGIAARTNPKRTI